MAAYEWLVVVYFSALIAAAWIVPVPMSRRLQATSLGAAPLVLVVVSRAVATDVRWWLPHFFLLAGYWMPGLLVPVTHGRRFEAWLVRSDARLRPSLPAVPAWAAPVVELAYLLCYPLVPVSFAIVWMNGTAADIERFWFAVLMAGYCCYVTLPWLVSRPPRLLHPDGTRRRTLGTINTQVLARASHEFNTFPSGHVAVTAAAAAAVATISVRDGALLGIVVVAICVGAASGRYHYVVDVLFGLGIAAAAHAAAAAL